LFLTTDAKQTQSSPIIMIHINQHDYLTVGSVYWKLARGITVIHVFHKAPELWNVFIFNGIHSLNKIKTIMHSAV